MQPYAAPAPAIAAAIARALAPRKPLTVSQWAGIERRLSSKGSAEPGRWRTDLQPAAARADGLPRRAPRPRMWCSNFPSSSENRMVAVNALGYTHGPQPRPGHGHAAGRGVDAQVGGAKLNPMIEETPAVRTTLTSTDSRNGSNRREFKDFAGGQFYIEHAGSPSRLKSTTVRTLIVDELDEFAANLVGGDDPVEMLNGRTSAFPATYKRLYISTPQIRGLSRIDALYEKRSAPLLRSVPALRRRAAAGMVRPALGSRRHRRRLRLPRVRRHDRRAPQAGNDRRRPLGGRNPGAKIRGYHINRALLPDRPRPRWADLVEMWLDAQNDPARLKTFINDRLAEAWEDPAMRAVKHNIIADRAERYPLRTAPAACWP